MYATNVTHQHWPWPAKFTFKDHKETVAPMVLILPDVKKWQRRLLRSGYVS